jgi:wyosine [tRNA(Phe)-imidazoG37] synthetase (radical SAM superfamily)
MQYVYGPIHSRRLGRSLGVDPIPLKTCNWNCVYCQLGRSLPLTNVRSEYIPRAAILAEIEESLAAPEIQAAVDVVTFAGSGEPTLHSGLGWLVRAVKALTPLPVAVITNGALLCRTDVQEDLLAADIVLPTVSAGTPALHRRIHRPHPDASFVQLVAGLKAFRTRYTGKLWVEVMLIRGLNDTEPSLRQLAALLQQIQPDQIQLLLPDRPPAEPWVDPAQLVGGRGAAAGRGAPAPVVSPLSAPIHVSGSLPAAIASIVSRHPMSFQQLASTLADWPPSAICAALTDLETHGIIRPVDRLGLRFWAAAAARFPTPPPPSNSLAS